MAITARSYLDEYTDLEIIIALHPFGHLCGYAEVPQDHAFRDRDEVFVTIDRPVTFRGELNHLGFDTIGDYYLGFDCAAGFDFIPSLHLLPFKPDGLIESYKDVAYVKERCRILTRDIKGWQ